MMRAARIPLCFLLVVISVSCGSRQTDTPPGAVNTLTVGILSEPSTLNPLGATSFQERDIIDLMFVTLLEEQSDFLNFAPRFAESWDFGPDSLAITFDLRRDLLWHDGEPVTAADVRFTWELQTDTVVAWAGRGIKERITDVEIIDDYKVIYHFASRYPNQLMDANDGVILPKHVLDRVPRDRLREADFGRHPIGNGPYAFKRWEPGQFVELERTDTYYDRDIVIDHVLFRIVPDMTTLVTLLKTGEIDCLESVPTDVMDEIQKKYEQIRLYRYRSRGMTFIAWNVEQPLLADRDIRTALAMAINSREIIQTLWAGAAEPGSGPMHPILWAHDPKLPLLPFDPDAARAVLAEKGWKDSDGDGVLDKAGRAFELEMVTNQGNQLRADIVTMVQQQLAGVGVKVNARILEWGAFLDHVLGGDFDSCVLGWKVPTRADLTNYWRSTATPRDGFNVSRYANPEVDRLIDEARDELNPELARKLWYECQRIIYDDQPMFFLAIPYEVVGLRDVFCNVRPNAISFFYNIEDWFVTEDCRY